MTAKLSERENRVQKRFISKFCFSEKGRVYLRTDEHGIDKIIDFILSELCASEKWISVKDRLPEKKGYYLVYSGKFPEPCRVCWFECGTFSWHSLSLENIGDYITHWTPSPRPPKDGAK
jgi:hypothetical protein